MGWSEGPVCERFCSRDARLADGKAPEGFDKEPVRLALGAAGYGGDGPPPELPDEVWIQTSCRYIELYERLTGMVFEPGALKLHVAFGEPAKAAALVTLELEDLFKHEVNSP